MLVLLMTGLLSLRKKQKQVLQILFIVWSACFFFLAEAQTVHYQLGNIKLELAENTAREDLALIFAEIESAKNDLKLHWGLRFEGNVSLRFHSDLDSFQEATQAAWFVSAQTNTQTQQINFQRITVLKERNI